MLILIDLGLENTLKFILNTNSMILKQTEIDEKELFLELLKTEQDINHLTYREIANLIQDKFGIECSEEDVNLLHEPTIDDMVYDSEYFYKQVLGY